MGRRLGGKGERGDMDLLDDVHTCLLIVAIRWFEISRAFAFSYV